MTTTTNPRPLQTRSALRAGRPPRPNPLTVLLDGLAAAGITIPTKASDAAAAAVKLDRAAAAAGNDYEQTPAAAAHARDRMRREAGKLRAAALAALDGKRIEAAGRKIVAEAVAAIKSADLPASVIDPGTAMAAADPAVAARWLDVVAANDRAARAWAALDLGRGLVVLPCALTRGDFNPEHEMSDALVGPRTHNGGGYFAPLSHRAERPGLVLIRSTVLEMLRAGAGPGVFDAASGRRAIVELAATMNGRPDDETGDQ